MYILPTTRYFIYTKSPNFTRKLVTILYNQNESLTRNLYWMKNESQKGETKKLPKTTLQENPSQKSIKINPVTILPSIEMRYLKTSTSSYLSHVPERQCGKENLLK